MGSLEDQLQSKIKNLRNSSTKVTRVDGRSFIETKSEKQQLFCDPLCPGFVVDTKPDLRISQILSYLYLGSQDVAHDLELLKSNNITHILNVSTGVLNLFEEMFIYKTVEALDTPEFPLLEVLDECCEFIQDTFTKEKGVILVHCNAGISRSASVVIAYIIKFYAMTLEEGLNFVKKRRPFVKPNGGFMKQLNLYEKT